MMIWCCPPQSNTANFDITEVSPNNERGDQVYPLSIVKAPSCDKNTGRHADNLSVCLPVCPSVKNHVNYLSNSFQTYDNNISKICQQADESMSRICHKSARHLSNICHQPKGRQNNALEAQEVTFVYTVKKRDDKDTLGLDVRYTKGELEVTTILEDGAVARENRERSIRGERVLQIRDMIKSVNGVGLNSHRMVKEMRGKLELSFEVFRA